MINLKGALLVSSHANHGPIFHAHWNSIGDFSDESSVFFCLLSFSIEYMQIFFSVGLYFVAFFAYFSDGVEFMKLVFFSSWIIYCYLALCVIQTKQAKSNTKAKFNYVQGRSKIVNETSKSSRRDAQRCHTRWLKTGKA